MDQKYESLFTPWKVGNVEIKNRIVMCPMGGTSLFGWFELTGCGFDKDPQEPEFVLCCGLTPCFLQIFNLRAKVLFFFDIRK